MSIYIYKAKNYKFNIIQKKFFNKITDYFTNNNYYFKQITNSSSIQNFIQFNSIKFKHSSLPLSYKF